MTVLNNLDLYMFGVGNVYLNKPAYEKLYTHTREKFGKDKGKLLVIVRILYGLRSSGAAYTDHFETLLLKLSFKSYHLADADVWRIEKKKPNSELYYKHILTCKENYLVSLHKPGGIILRLEGDKDDPHRYRLKDIGEPTIYLGAKMGKYYLLDCNVI